MTQVPAAPAAVTPVHGTVLQRKCACGGTPGPVGQCAECRRKHSPGGLQAKRRVGPADDPWEREADRIADRVTGPGFTQGGVGFGQIPVHPTGGTGGPPKPSTPGRTP